MKINRQSIQSAVIEGDIESAIEQFLSLAERFDNRLHNDVINISSQFKGLQRDILGGRIGSEYAGISKARIGSAVTEYLKKVQPGWEMEAEILSAGNGAGSTAAPSPSPTSPPAGGQKTILFLSANPVETQPLRLGEEARRIEERLKKSRQRDSFRFVTKWAVRIPDLQDSLLELDQAKMLVHFSGHGSEIGAIYLENQMGNGQEVSPEALGELFELFKDQVECVLLNACYSERQANEIVKHIPYVIGMNTAVPDQAALEFSDAFYGAIGAGRNIEFAFKLGVNSVKLYGLEAENIPVLKKMAA
ncbi:MAG: hypothetical protein AAB316_13115 [Bacteroidota bacterium]